MPSSTTAIVATACVAMLYFQDVARGQGTAVPKKLAVAVVDSVGPDKSGAWLVAQPPQPLTPWDALMTGDHIACKPGTVVKLIAISGPQTVTSNQCAVPGGYVVSFGTEKGAYASAIENYGKVAGRPRGGLSGLLLWPTSDVKMRADTAAATEWRPQAGGILAISLLADQSERVLWSQDVDAGTGHLKSDALASVLRELTTAGDATVKLQVRLSPTRSDSATFTVVGDAVERRVVARLKELEGVSGVSGTLLRAEVFLQESLPREALDVYVAAIATSPDAPFLIEKAAAIAAEIGDPRGPDLARRAKALSTR